MLKTNHKGGNIMSKQLFGQRLRALRKKHKLTQAQLAKQLNRAESTVRMWELGKNEPDNETLNLISNIFHVSIEYLLGNDTVYLGVTPISTNLLSTKPNVELPQNANNPLSELSPIENCLLIAFKRLNEEGKSKIFDYTSDIILLPKYLTNDIENNIKTENNNRKKTDHISNDLLSQLIKKGKK